MSARLATLFGLSFSTAPAEAALRAAELAPADGVRLIVTINIDHAVTLAENAAFRQAYAKAVLRTLDGMPLVLLARLRGAREARRVTGHDLLAALLARGPLAEDRIFALAATAAVAAAIARKFVEHGWPPEAVRTDVPAFGFETDTVETARLTGAIRAHKTTWLLMGVGAPKSEIWVMRQGSACGAPVVLCIGDALNVAAGSGVRAPGWLQAMGLEWAWRFAASPRRLFRRYFVRSLRFPLLALRNPDFSTARVPQDRG